ncbi:hypothetical protein CUR178_02024 [Leishmania enriettii]|uniref:Uncharacterized protein n=1 Tax=Leishmania enriettii TaxID=5663 RepID=A0A836KEQ5_LEIEN|nr:hypothetical protein CUR178_02024 [Leishmania enriettii]
MQTEKAQENINGAVMCGYTIPGDTRMMSPLHAILYATTAHTRREALVNADADHSVRSARSCTTDPPPRVPRRQQ